MDIADGEVPGKLILAGLIALDEKWITVPDDHEHFMPLQLAYRCLPLLSHARIDGIKYGTGATHLPPMPRVRTGTLIAWLRTNRNRHMIQQVQPDKGTSLRSLLGSKWEDWSVILFYRYAQHEENDRPTESVDLDMSEIEAIPEDVFPSDFDILDDIKVDKSRLEPVPEEHDTSNSPPHGNRSRSRTNGSSIRKNVTISETQEHHEPGEHNRVDPGSRSRSRDRRSDQPSGSSSHDI